VKPDTLTLAELFDAYREKKGKHLVGQWQRPRRRAVVFSLSAGAQARS